MQCYTNSPKIPHFFTDISTKTDTVRWKEMNAGILKVLEGEKPDFENLCHNSHNMVMRGFGDKLYANISTTLLEHIDVKIKPTIENAIDEDFLGVVFDEYERYSQAAKEIACIFMHVDRIYVQIAKQNDIYTNALITFRDNVLADERFIQKLRGMLMDIARETWQGSMGNEAERKMSLLKRGCRMMTDVSIGDCFYEKNFEHSLIEGMKAFYTNASENLLSNCTSTVEYSKMAIEQIRKEETCVSLYATSDTLSKVSNLLSNLYIGRFVTQIFQLPSSVPNIIESDAVAELKAVYDFVTLVPNEGVKELTAEISRYLSTTGKAKIVSNSEPVKFLDAFYEMKVRFDRYYTEAFKEDKILHNQIQSGFTKIMNSNPKCAEYLSSYIDHILRNVKSIDETMKVLSIFRFVDEKDAFERHYRLKFSKRLLLDWPNIDWDTEKEIISAFKSECGMHFTNRLETMIRDGENWIEHQLHFKSAQREAIPLQYALIVRILTDFAWPVTPDCSLILPQELEEGYSRFKESYLSKHNGRKLMLISSIGFVDLKATFYAPNNTSTYFVRVNLHQALILLLFNKAESYTFAELLAQTRLPEVELKKNLIIMSMTSNGQRLLKKSGNAGEIANEDRFLVNDDFYSKRYKVKIKNLRIEEEKTTEKIIEEVEIDRKHEVDACIVRVMKSKKTLPHKDLLNEVMALLEVRFRPEPQMIKLRIESLIDRDYLNRDPSNPQVYAYA